MTTNVEKKTFFIRTFGCQMNQHDSERMASLLGSVGFVPALDGDKADVVIINSCSVRAKPEHKAVSEAGRYQHAKKRLGTKIILAGCVARQEGVELLKLAPFVDAVVSPDAIGQLGRIVSRLFMGEQGIVAVQDHDEQHPMFVPLMPGSSLGVSRLVTIMKGCNNFCTYCIVPYVRGREVSRSVEDIVQEVERLSSRGVREVTLLGQNVNSYRDPISGKGFPALLEILDGSHWVDRIRFTTSHPKDLGPDLVQALERCPSVVEHLHLALQAGSNRILEKMGRGYTQKDFLQKVHQLRSRVANISITTDLIVGFPTETESDFQQTLYAVEQAAFDSAFSFKYSPRPGTKAARMADDVPPQVKQERLLRLHALLDELEQDSLARLVGKSVEVMVEGRSVRDSEVFRGRTRCNRVVNFESRTALSEGSSVAVEIVESRGHTLYGKRCEALAADLAGLRV